MSPLICFILSAVAIFECIFATNCPLPPSFSGAQSVDEYSITEIALTSSWVAPELSGYETPITMRIVMAIGTIQWDCMATYDDKALGVRTLERPLLSNNIPSELRVSDDNKLACYAYAFPFMIEAVTGTPLVVQFGMDALFTSYGFRSMIELTAMKAQIDACNDDEICIDNIASSYNYCPDIMGVIVGKTLRKTLENDGYNQDGSKTPFGECTANCRPFSDPIGFYDPRVDKTDIKMNKNPINKWQQLLEDDDKGFFYRQEHVTPHIGYTADPITFSKDRYEELSTRIDDPKYDYELEAELLLQRLAEIATNNTKKAIIESFDDKIAVAAYVQLAHWSIFSPSYKQNVMMETGNRIAEYQAVLLSWREKVKYNRIRPTTLVQSGKYTSDEITTYGGIFEGVQTISTYDFQPYIRTMPHSEYPSGSACICRMLYDHADTFIQHQHFAPSMPVFFFFWPPGAPSKYEPNYANPNGPPFIEDTQFIFQNLKELYEMCAESRLWGGMHFTASIEAGDKLCQGFGDEIYDYLQSVLNGVVPDIVGAEDDHKKTTQKTGLKEVEQAKLNQAQTNVNKYVDEYKMDKKGEKATITEMGGNTNLFIGIGVFIAFIVLLSVSINIYFCYKTKYFTSKTKSIEVINMVETINPNHTNPSNLSDTGDVI